MENCMNISGARENNLKNIDVSIPCGKHTVITGVSGSGKTSLAWDVLYAAGKKRLMECMDQKDRRILAQLRQPDVDYIEGLMPMIGIRQQKPGRNPRATVGTASETAMLLGSVFSLLATAVCPLCGAQYPACSFGELVNGIAAMPENTVLEVLAPVYKGRLESWDDFFAGLRKKGYRKVFVDGQEKSLQDWIGVEGDDPLILLYAGYLMSAKVLGKSQLQLLQTAVQLGGGLVRLKVRKKDGEEAAVPFRGGRCCPSHGMFAVDILPSYFNRNDMKSSCAECLGTGVGKEANPLLLLRDGNRSLQKGPFHTAICNVSQPYWYMLLYSLSVRYGFSFTEPFGELPEAARNLVWYGTDGERFPLLRPEGYEKQMPGYTPREGELVDFEGFIMRQRSWFENSKKEEWSASGEELFRKYMEEVVCRSCHGTGLKRQRDFFRLAGLSYDTLCGLELEELQAVLEGITVPAEKERAFRPMERELSRKLCGLTEIGLGYLSLNRRIDTLSGGEYQRVRLMGQLGAGLRGLCYIIDEPTAGLHSADTEKIQRVLRRFLREGNTVVTVEHDLNIIRSADHVIELGEGAGKHGGRVTAAGTVPELMERESSVIGRYLRNERMQGPPETTGAPGEWIRLRGLRANNLKSADVDLPLYRLVCLTGVSGSGKSSVAVETLYKAVRQRFRSSVIPGAFDRIEGLEPVKNAYCIDQRPINRARTSTPASYIGVMDRIRSLFAASPEAKERGLGEAAYFSHNTKGGCPACNGLGYTEAHIHYLGDTRLLCPACGGRRYRDEVLEVRLRGKNIAGVLGMSFEEARVFFGGEPYIRNKLRYVCELGLQYLPLGQPVQSLSGGEGQRLLLAKELGRNRGKKGMLYILDEPTTGLHAGDVEKMTGCLRRIIAEGNTVLIIEHNTLLIGQADYIVDMGPGAGRRGGSVVVQGGPDTVMGCEASLTGRCLRLGSAEPNDSL